jgi:NTP pyrophosphatase (non-canonical NTP hydrolase)
MDFLNYTCFVEGLAADASKVDFNARLLTSILGLTGEAAECVEVMKASAFESEEFNRTKLVDECSDLMWYVAFATTTLEVSLSDLIDKHKIGVNPNFGYNITLDMDDLLEAVLNVSCASGKCADITKKYLFHSKPFNKEKLLEALDDVVKHIAETAGVMGLTIQDVVDVNVVKLKDRYKTGKFTFEEFMKKETA